ncbi:Type II secretion system protein J [Burkholderiales bacterium]|nr:Type II secretion system protein J [Burkholderiales bacterium]
MTRARIAGFTLVEVLVALAVLAVFATFAWRATASLVDGEARLASESRRWQELDAMFARIEADVRAAVPRAVRVAERRERAWVGTVGTDGQSAFAFTRAGGTPPDAGTEGVRLAYRMRGDSVEILYWPALDRAAGVEPAAWALAGGIARLDVRYADDDGGWTDRWPPDRRDALPRALVVGVTLADGARLERFIVLR